MKISLERNCLEKDRKAVSLYSGCCCCCCCLLTPVGNWLGEVATKKITKHTQSLWQRFFINLIFAIGSGALGWGVMAMSPRGGDQAALAIIAAVVTYYALLLQHSMSWLKDVTNQRRYFVVFIEWLLSLLFMAIFFAISIFACLALLWR